MTLDLQADTLDLQKENQCASNRITASQLQIHLSFPFCENRSGPFKYSSFVTGSVNRGCCRDRRKGLLLISSGLAPPPPPQQRGSLPVSILTLVRTPQGFCPSSSSDRLPQHLAPEAHALSPAPHSCGVRWPAASPGTRLGWFYSRSASS